MPKLGLDEQKPDTRPARWGNPAMDGDARYHPDTRQVNPARPERRATYLPWEISALLRTTREGDGTIRNGATERRRRERRSQPRP